MSYENAPGTRLVATHCAFCHKPLVDATSVEVGAGPTCRKKYLKDLEELDEEVRKQANKLVHYIAANQNDNQDLVESLNTLAELPVPNLVLALLKSLVKVAITLTGEDHPHGADRYAVKAPYDEDAVFAFRNVRGRRWDKENKVNTFPVNSKVDIWKVLCNFYEGCLATGPKGVFVVKCN